MKTKLRLLVIHGELMDRGFTLDKNESIIGSAKHCEIVIEQDGVAPEHTIIRNSEGVFTLEAKPLCPVYVNTRRVKNQIILSDGHLILIGLTVFRVVLFKENLVSGVPETSEETDEP